MDSDKSINSFKIKKDGLPDHLLNNFFSNIMIMENCF